MTLVLCTGHRSFCTPLAALRALYMFNQQQCCAYALQGLWGQLLRPEQLQEALASSLTTLLWAARSSSSAAKVVMLPVATSSAAARGMCDAAQAARMAQVAAADSRQQLEVSTQAAARHKIRGACYLACWEGQTHETNICLHCFIRLSPIVRV